MTKDTIKQIAVGVIVAFMTLVIACSLIGCGENKDNTNNANTNTNATKPASQNRNIVRTVDTTDVYASGVHHAIVEVEGYDPFTIEINSDAAPISATNFADLVNQGYYNGLTFYRFQEGFCMQGGTSGNSASGNDPTISKIMGEFSENNVDNPLADDFGYGTVAMARSNNPDSASSTFFITTGDKAAVGESLNGKYAAFGIINADDMKIVEKIIADHAQAAAADPMGMIENVDDQATITSIRMVD